MQSALIVEQLAAVRYQLERACDRLTSPSAEALDGCAVDLESAARQLSEWKPMFAGNAGNAAALEEAWKVRRSFLRARKLMENTSEFHNNWVRVRGSISGGYTSTGEPGEVYPGGRICLQA